MHCSAVEILLSAFMPFTGIVFPTFWLHCLETTDLIPLQLKSEVYPRLQTQNFQNGEITTEVCVRSSDGHITHPAYKALPFTLQGLRIRHGAWKLLGRLSSDTEKEDGSSQTSCLLKTLGRMWMKLEAKQIWRKWMKLEARRVLMTELW